MSKSGKNAYFCPFFHSKTDFCDMPPHTSFCEFVDKKYINKYIDI